MYTVTRQLQLPDGNAVVEVSCGGLDYTNPDALMARYDGEFEEFADPREAIEAAIKVCAAWKNDGEAGAKIAHGATLGFTMPFDGCTAEEGRKWAEAEYNSLEKCPTCNDILEEPEEWYEAGWFNCAGDFLSYGDGLKYCSAQCAETASEFEEEVKK